MPADRSGLIILKLAKQFSVVVQLHFKQSQQQPEQQSIQPKQPIGQPFIEQPESVVVRLSIAKFVVAKFPEFRKFAQFWQLRKFRAVVRKFCSIIWWFIESIIRPVIWQFRRFEQRYIVRQRWIQCGKFW